MTKRRYATCRSGAVWEGGGNMRRVVGEGGVRTYSCRIIGNVDKNNQTQYKNEYNNNNNKNNNNNNNSNNSNNSNNNNNNKNKNKNKNRPGQTNKLTNNQDRKKQTIITSGFARARQPRTSTSIIFARALEPSNHGGTRART